MKRGNFISLALALLVILLPGFSQTIVSRTYWPVSPATYSASGSPHTHVQVVGYVTYTRWEDDGDLHVRVCAALSSTACFIAECIPKLPCARPPTGRKVLVKGITRRDPEHAWWEIHPVEYLEVLP